MKRKKKSKNSSLGWVAWKNIMPGSAPTLHIRGHVWAPTPCDQPVLERDNSPHVTESLAFILKFKRDAGVCLQVMTNKEVTYSQKYSGLHTSVIITLPDKVKINIPIQTVS